MVEIIAAIHGRTGHIICDGVTVWIVRGGWPNHRASTIFFTEATAWEIVWNSTFISVGIEEFASIFTSGVNATSDGVDQVTAVNTRAVAGVTVRDSLLLETRFWIIFVDNHFVDLNGLISASVGSIWGFGDQFVLTWSDTIISANIDSGTEEADPIFRGFDIAMNGSIKVVWGVNRRFLLGFAEVLSSGANAAIRILFFPVSFITIFRFPIITKTVRKMRCTITTHINL